MSSTPFARAVACACLTLSGAALAAPATYLEPAHRSWLNDFDGMAPAVTTLVTDHKNTEARFVGSVISHANGAATHNIVRFRGEGLASAGSGVAGELVGVGARMESAVQIEGQAVPVPGPNSPNGSHNARAQTGTLGGVQGNTLIDFWSSRVETRTNRTVQRGGTYTYQDQNVCAGGIFCLDDPVQTPVWVNDRHDARAASWWLDTWTPDRDTVVTLQFRVHLNLGQIFGSRADNFLDLSLGRLTREGLQNTPLTDVYDRVRPDAALMAGLGVWDLSDRSEFYCENEEPSCPLQVAENFVRDAAALDYLMEAGGSLEIDTVLELSFLALQGHDYRVLGGADVSSFGGADSDGFNTFALTGVSLTNGATLRSAAAELFNLRLPIGPGAENPVPEPGSGALLAAALVLLARSRYFGAAASGFAGCASVHASSRASASLRSESSR